MSHWESVFICSTLFEGYLKMPNGFSGSLYAGMGGLAKAS
ncbi:hypothetical protein EIKCOROL_01882 [Eikenella corrodens ATCC 23834]|uniref:Uncharacterized protein n=1 Tax=Eikenella corrodens ATCC 23834 TaxID=546274 RepID=C0DWX8_EIKCO|nr:hypothetical protein EIKCOROL_01882 [Eikenella corrodens ATCC 23834]